MDCCITETGADEPLNETDVKSGNDQKAPGPVADTHETCRSCKTSCRPVSRKTMMLMLKQDRFELIGASQYHFCAAVDCRIVYFTESNGSTFGTDDVRLRVGPKYGLGPIPLCYCFGFDEIHARAEIATTGQCTIPQRIYALIKEGMCECPARNPSGVCCLGDVNKAVQTLLIEVEVHV